MLPYRWSAKQCKGCHVCQRRAAGPTSAPGPRLSCLLSNQALGLSLQVVHSVTRATPMEVQTSCAHWARVLCKLTVNTIAETTSIIIHAFFQMTTTRNLLVARPRFQCRLRSMHHVSAASNVC